MDNIISFNDPEDVKGLMAQEFKRQRLARGFTQKTLSNRSGVPEPTLKRFEHTGNASFLTVLKIADGLEILGEFESFIESLAKSTLSAEDVRKLASAKVRKRGVR